MRESGVSLREEVASAQTFQDYDAGEDGKIEITEEALTTTTTTTTTTTMIYGKILAIYRKTIRKI